MQATEPLDPHRRLAELKLVLPPPSPPGGVYTPAVRSGRYVFVSGQIPMEQGAVTTVGKVGAEVTPEQAYTLSRHCALAALAAIDAVAGLDRVSQVVKVTGYVASATDFTAQAGVVDGASELLLAVFGPAGRHARSSVGVAELPRGAPVEIEITVEITP
ncbi:enamine deaminase RidA (YjgF/YER057c/UK114 family) [Kitasatospora gansuensis]|uniref:Enamine deaminase RidA (YjgF/YER057c/UK114 family) n=1 Tax=Kitasatospora gansuensis TaxID=258050 RepID=A0A7W7S745_9ACTN|nr:RidA family protein [Kitasatospora gansuensis]MBB4944912.1 enamine deaminase RidA (YjgF/YER057c/UK114 family) [Kitasatospora gansuensis]